MKINIKNLLFQPLALHLAADGALRQAQDGLHLSARECREILKEHVSEEIQRAAVRGLVSLIDKVGGDAAVSESAAPQSDEPQTRQRKGNRR